MRIRPALLLITVFAVAALVVPLLLLLTHSAPTVIVPNNALIPANTHGVNVYMHADTRAPVLDRITSKALLSVIGRTGDGAWYNVITSHKYLGWVCAACITLNTDQSSIPLVDPKQQDVYARWITGITDTSRTIFQRGRDLGNRPNVFSKIGDSITASHYFLYPFGWGTYNLRDHDDLAPVIDYFSQATARTSNSFANDSLAAKVGWSSRDLLSPRQATAAECKRNENPLVCEYRVVKPAVALIMIGTNDFGTVSVDEARSNLSKIVETSINMGVVPVLSTIPLQRNPATPIDAYNAIIAEVAHTYDIPLWDFGGALNTLPNHGISSDGIHPSYPLSGNFKDSADFSPENMYYGFTVRNYMALEILNDLWREVITTLPPLAELLPTPVG